MLNSALLHSTLGQCEAIPDCSYIGQTFLEKRNINNVSQVDQTATDQGEADRQAGAAANDDLIDQTEHDEDFAQKQILTDLSKDADEKTQIRRCCSIV